MDTYEAIGPRYRGYGKNDDGEYLQLGLYATWREFQGDATTDSWYILPGQVCPIAGNGPDDSYSVVWTFSFDGTNISPNARMSFAFGVPHDGDFRDGDNLNDESIGYVYQEEFNGFGTLYRIRSATELTVVGTHQFPAHTVGERISRGVRMSAAKASIVGSDSTEVIVDPNPELRGGYIYIGKRDIRVSDSNDGRFRLHIHQLDTYSPAI